MERLSDLIGFATFFDNVNALLMILLVLLFWLRLRKTNLHEEQVSAIPGPNTFWFLWTVFKYSWRGTLNVDLQQLLSSLCRLYDKHSLFRIWLFNVPVVVVFKAETIEPLLSNDEFLERAPEYSFGNPLIGNGLITSPVEKWRKRRRLLNTAFHYRILEDCLPIFNRQCKILIDKLRQKGSVNIVPFVQSCTLDIICETAMGVDIGSQRGNSMEYVKALHRITEILPERVMQPWLHPDIIFYNTPLGWEFKKALKIALDFTKRGHDTAAVSVPWALFLIGNDAQVQENIHKEMDAIFSGDNERPVTFHDLRQMDYLKCVIKETLRLYPPGDIIARLLPKELVLGNRVIPAGTRCLLFIHELHRDEKYFPNPVAFKPDRFFSSSPKHPYAYIPFSAGPRNCIGQKFALLEIQTLLANILRNFKIRSADTRDKIKLAMEVVLRPADPIHLHFRSR